MTFSECKDIISSDLKRLSPQIGFGKGLKYLLFNHSFRITFWFRIGSYLRQKKDPFSKFFYHLVFFIHKYNQYLTGIQLPIGTNIGKGLSFPHFCCIVINHGSTIGQDCTIFQGVTIGSKRGRDGGAPTLGDGVVIAAGAKIIGNVRIGSHVMIGANTVVVKDVPDYAVVVGNPGRVVNYDGKYHSELYLFN